MAEWDDLFAMAAGNEIDHTLNQASKSRQETGNNKTQTSNKHRKRKKPPLCVDSEFSQMLAGRMITPTPQGTIWPPWLQIGSLHVSKTECPGWEDASSKKESSKGYQKRSCRHCKKSPLYHRVQLSLPSDGLYKRDTFFPLAMFCVLRNVRCCASIMSSSSGENHSSLAKAIRNEADRLQNLVKPSESTLPPGEGSLLEAKCAKLIESASSVFKHTKQETPGTNHALLEDIVRLIIASDAVYYRLYYLQIAKILPTCKRDGGCFFLPHPTEYFLTPYLCWDVIKGSIIMKEFIGALRSEFFAESEQDTSTWFSTLRRYGIDQPDKLRENDNPLSALHHNRLMETVTLFYKSGFVSSTHAQTETLKALENNYSSENIFSCHETPAPQILMEWRDSCRDLLCNLYAYAALAPGTERRIKDLLNDHNISGGLIEIGAGTGYISRLLKDAGINITAWDLRPTGRAGTMNEYHGCTPPFFEVQEGNVGALKRYIQIGSLSLKDTGLLLCYPPPQSTMAWDALQTYVDAGGQCLVHIGEFCGLTGSAEFESLLTRNFQCIVRIPCLTWGTDASEVTLWIRTDVVRPNSPSRLLLPCCNCGERSAVKRCRLARSLVYCREECFRVHKRVRDIDLAINMIEVGQTPLDFDNDNHFVAIKSFDTVAEPGAREHRHNDVATKIRNRKRKKRRKKNGP